MITGLSTGGIVNFPTNYNFNGSVMLTTISENLRTYLINHFLDMELESRKIIYSNDELYNFIGMLESQDNDTVRLAISIMSGMDPSYINKINNGFAEKTGCSASLFFSDLTTLEEMMMIWTPIYINRKLYEQKYPELKLSGVVAPHLYYSNISSGVLIHGT